MAAPAVRPREAPVTDTGGPAWFSWRTPGGLFEPFCAGWQAADGQPFVLRLARAQAAEMAAARPVIEPGERIVGDWGFNPIVSGRETPFGNGIRLDRGAAEARRREHPEQAAAIDALVEEWATWLRDNPRRRPLTCHASLALERVLEWGLDGMLAHVERHRARNVTGPGELADWYEALAVTVRGMSDFVLAHAAAVEQAGRSGESLRWLAHGAPRTFAEAVQLFYLVFLLAGHDSPGPIDRLLGPALARDADLPGDEAQALIDALWLKMAAKTAYGATLGGQLPDGGDAVNDVSYLCLEAIDRLRLLSPRTTVRWHSAIDPAFWRRAVEVNAAGAGYPSFVNDHAVVAAALARGRTLAEAREYTFVGCGQVFPHGRGHGSYEDVVINGARPFELALHNGRDPRTGEQLGPATGEPAELTNYAAFEAACRAQMDAHLTACIEHVNRRRAENVGQAFDLIRSLLTASCVERGLDWHGGGAEASEGMVDVVGLTTWIDSLLAVRHGVFEQGRLTLPELVAVLDSDWAEAEPLRRWFLRELPKFGNGDDAADDFAAAESARVDAHIRSHRTVFGGPWGLDVIGWSGAVAFGEQTGATPDGRRRGESLADCAGPAQGRNRQGLGTTLGACLRLPHATAHGPLAVSLRFPREAVDGVKGVDALQAVIETYFRGGGQQLQISVASTEELRAAQADPAAYDWLIVRVGGFNARFAELDRRWQDDLIARSEMGL